MNDEKDVFQIRLNLGRYEYRQRVTIHGSQLDHIAKLIVTKDWGPWERVEALNGDESDERRWPT